MGTTVAMVGMEVPPLFLPGTRTHEGNQHAGGLVPAPYVTHVATALHQRQRQLELKPVFPPKIVVFLSGLERDCLGKYEHEQDKNVVEGDSG